MPRIHWGVLSTANIGVQKVIPALQDSQLGKVAAIASRGLEPAQRAAQSLRIPKAYGSYEELLADPDIDAIYNPLPNHLHVPWTLRAIEAGKHVLCEKPVGLNTAEAEELLAAAQRNPHLQVMEAFMYRFHPQWQRAQELATDGSIGELRTIQSFFSYSNLDPNNIRNHFKEGGGGLMDIGCYPISLSRFLFDSEPTRVFGTLENDPEFGVDRLSSAIMEFDSGSETGTATFTCGTQLVPYQRVQIFGTEGRIELEIPFNAPPNEPCRLWLQQGEAIEEIVLPICDQYTLQGDLFAEAILNDTPVPTPLSDSVANMRVIDAIVKSAAAGQAVSMVVDLAVE